MPASVVLASCRPSTYPPGTPRSSLAAALLDGHLSTQQVFVRSLFVRIYETFTSIDFGFAFSDLGSRTFSTPSLYSALTLPPSASSGRVKLRIKLP